MNLAELKTKKIGELVQLARTLKVEGYSSLRKQELIFAILKAQSEQRREDAGQWCSGNFTGWIWFFACS